MSSRFLSCLFLVGSSLSFLGCEWPLNEKPPVTDPIVVGLDGQTACLSSVVPVLDHYFTGEAKDAEVAAAWDCASKAISTFAESTQGRYEDRFTARELAHFVEQYFMEKGTRIPNPLLVEIFRIKQLFVGGELNSLSRVEMKRLNSTLTELKRISLALNPHMRVFTLHWKTRGAEARTLDIQTFETANVAIQQATKDLAVLIEKNGMPYHLGNIVLLLQELSNFSQNQWTWLGKVEKAMPLVEKLKQALAGGEPGDVAPTEWRRFALLGARGYVQYLRYYYFIQSADLSAGGTELVYFVRSVDDLFSYLGDMVDGKPGQVLTREELLGILQSLSDFVPKLKISDELLVQAMKIKVVFFGGRLDHFQKADFDRARAKLDAFRVLTEKFLNYSSVYSLAWKPHQSLRRSDSQAYFKLAESNLTEFGERLGSIMENSYDLQDLIKLAAEVDKLYFPLGPDHKSLKDIATETIPVVITFKNILFTDQSSVIGASREAPSEQWRLFLKTSAELYSRFMYYTYFVKDQSMTEEPGLSFFNRLVVDTTYFLDHLIAAKQSKMISFNEIGQLWSSLSQAGLFHQKISQDTVVGLSQTLTQKILLKSEDRLAGKIPQGLTFANTEVLRNEFSMWVESQQFLSLVYQGVPENVGKSSSSLIADLNSATPTFSLLEMKMIYTGPLPLSFDSVGRLYLSKPSLNYRKSTSDLINVVREATRLVIHGYAMNMDRINTYEGITKAEANALFSDLKPLVVELDLMSADNKGFADSRFRDANLFTPVGTGDDLADFKEMSNLFMMIVSGLKIDSLMFEKLEQVCPLQKPSAVKNEWTVKLDCLVPTYAQEMPRQFVSMPDFLKFQATLSADHFQTMFIGLLKATGAVISDQGDVKIGDLALFPHIVQYVEGIFQVYDINRSGDLTTPEALKAFPTYRAILKQVSGLKDEQQLKGLFTWLLKYGKPPQTFAEKAKFMTWWVPLGEKGWDISANRETLAKILGFIADALNSNQSGTVPMDLRDLAERSQAQ